MRGNTRTQHWKLGALAATAALGLGGLALAQSQTSGELREARTNSAEFTMAQSWQKATDLTGKKVTNNSNENLGKIEDIVVDADSGRVIYGVLSFGGILGVGDKLFAIPWQALSLSGDANAFTLNVEKDQLKNAPGFDKQQWPNFADEQFLTATYKYYDQKPYWHSQKKEVSKASDSEGKVRTHDRDRWNQRTTNWQKVSDLCGKDVRNNQDVVLGKISDLAIDPQHGRILYGVLSSHSKLFAIPWSALHLSADSKQLVMDVKADQLNDTVAFDKDSWPNMADEIWANETHTYYKVQPYWTDMHSDRTLAKP